MTPARLPDCCLLSTLQPRLIRVGRIIESVYLAYKQELPSKRVRRLHVRCFTGGFTLLRRRNDIARSLAGPKCKIRYRPYYLLSFVAYHVFV